MADAKRDIFINVDRLNRLLDENGLDAVVARSGRNFTYLSGFAYPGTLARLLDLPDSARGGMVLWPRSGEPVLIVNGTAPGLAARDSWIERQVCYEGYVESPYKRLGELLHDEGLVHHLHRHQLAARLPFPLHQQHLAKAALDEHVHHVEILGGLLVPPRRG